MTKSEAITILEMWTSKNEEMDSILLNWGPETGIPNGLCGEDETYTGDPTYNFAMVLLKMVFKAVPEKAKSKRYEYLHKRLVEWEAL
jgi:hypothetical protein